MILDYLVIFIFLVAVCHKYQNLTDAERRHDFVTKSSKCDIPLQGWYRFQGAAGTKMVTTAPPERRCGAHFPAWLKGKHPTVAEGTKRKTVCIHKFNKDCFGSVLIDVRNCGSYYIYNLLPLRGYCDARYCGTD